MKKYIYAAIAVVVIYLLWQWNKNRPAQLPEMRLPGSLVTFKMQTGDVGYSGAQALEIRKDRNYQLYEVVLFNDCFIPYDIIIRGQTMYINECERSNNLVRNTIPKTQ